MAIEQKRCNTYKRAPNPDLAPRPPPRFDREAMGPPREAKVGLPPLKEEEAL